MQLISIKRRTPGEANFEAELLDCQNEYKPFTFWAVDNEDIKTRMEQLGFPEFVIEGNSAYVPYQAGTGKYDDLFWSEWK